MSRIERLDKLSLKVNGGPGSGNFNPGQGRGIGKPSKSSILSNKMKSLSWNETQDLLRDKETRQIIKEIGLKTYDDLWNMWAKVKIEDFTEKDIKEIDIDDAFDVVRKNIRLSALEGWFVNADSNYKPEIVTKILENKELRNAGLNIAYYNYKNRFESDISFSDFIKTPISLYRGEHGQTHVTQDWFDAYTPAKDIAEGFGEIVTEIKIKPIETLGVYFDNAESEYLVLTKTSMYNMNSMKDENLFITRINKLDKILNSINENLDYRYDVKAYKEYLKEWLKHKDEPEYLKNGVLSFFEFWEYDIDYDFEDYDKILKIIDEFNNKQEKITNGGPGSGNFNPGQGRGVGKPANGSNKSSTTFSVDDYSKERLNEVLEKYGVETDTNIGIAISNAAWRNGNKEDYKKVEKILEERYGEDWYDNDEAEKDADYLEYLERKAKRIEELQKKIYSELGIEFDPNSFWISKETYDGIQKAIKEGKLKEFINGDTPLAEEDPNFVRDPESAIGFYRQKSFNFDNGNFNVEMMTSSSESGYSDISEDNFINKSDYDNFMKRKMVKVNNDEVRSWYTILDKAGTYPPISRAEERSLQEYNLASAVNQQLREGKTSKTAENIASAINKKYSHSDEVYRGIRGDFAKKISSLKKGDTVTDKGFMSTSSIIGGDDSGAAKFGKTIMKIKTKSGFGQSIDMAPYVKDMRYLDEGEILLQKDTTVKYTGNSSKTIDKDGNDIMIYEFEVE